jgi:agrin
MKGIVLQIVCYAAVLASFAPWPETSASSSSPIITTSTLPPSTTFNPTGSICNGFICPSNRVCAIAGNRAICVCIENCYSYVDRVCGTNNQTYFNDCELRKQSCLTNKTITIDYYGVCKQVTACDGFSCPNGTQCAIDERKGPVCVCLDKCSNATGEICGTDGRTYGSECELYGQACNSATSIRIAYKGYCFNGSVCSGFRCPNNKQCNVNQDNKPVCVCSQSCPSEYAPVCGSDGVTYSSLCYLERQACTAGTNLTVVRKGQCSYDPLCFGVVCQHPKTCVADAKNQTSCVCNNSCGDVYYPVCGSDNKTYDNYCWFIYAACQRNLSTNYNHFGVCSEGSDCEGIGCPAGQHCDSQNQSQPKCVCNTVCSKISSPVCGSNNKTYSNPCELQKDACLTNTSIWTSFNGRCEDGPGCRYNYCPYGRVCVVDERNQPMCVCSLSCRTGSSEVCGSDGKTYSNECFLRAAACLTNKTIAVQSYEACERDGPCRDFVCSSDRYCKVGQNGKSICVCNDHCNSYSSSFCGRDNNTYSSLCALQKKACISSASILWIYHSPCAEGTVCDKISCPPDKKCAIDERNQPTCVCIDQCAYVQDLVCGSDGRTYINDCEMRKAACRSNRNVTTKYRGKCDKDSNSTSTTSKRPCVGPSCTTSTATTATTTMTTTSTTTTLIP